MADSVKEVEDKTVISVLLNNPAVTSQTTAALSGCEVEEEIASHSLVG